MALRDQFHCERDKLERERDEQHSERDKPPLQCDKPQKKLPTKAGSQFLSQISPQVEHHSL